MEPTPAGIKLVMFVCAFLALAGVLVTVFCIPQYRPRDLVYEGKYHPLPHRCLRPSEAQLALLGDRYYEEPDEEEQEEEEQQEMVQIVERCDNYELTSSYPPEDTSTLNTQANSRRSTADPISSYHQLGSSSSLVV